MVDLTRDKNGRLRARLLDLVPGRSSEAYTSWLRDRGDTFRKDIEIATLDSSHGYRYAIDDQLDHTIAVLEAFHVVKLDTSAVDEVRRRVQQDIHGHRGRKDDPLYRIRNLLRAGKGASHQPAEDPPGDRIHHQRPTRRNRDRLALHPTAPLGLSPVTSRRRPQDRGEDPCLVPVVSDPRDHPPRPDTKPVARHVPGLLHHQRRQQQRNRSHQRVNRTRTPRRPRLPHPRQLPPQNTPHRQRSTTITPHSGTKSQHGLLASAGRTGVCYDNAAAESFNATRKKELVNRKIYHIRRKAIKEVTSWIELCYNQAGLHSAIGYRTPNEVDQEWRKTKTAA